MRIKTDRPSLLVF